MIKSGGNRKPVKLDRGAGSRGWRRRIAQLAQLAIGARDSAPGAIAIAPIDALTTAFAVARAAHLVGLGRHHRIGQRHDHLLQQIRRRGGQMLFHSSTGAILLLIANIQVVQHGTVRLRTEKPK